MMNDYNFGADREHEFEQTRTQRSVSRNPTVTDRLDTIFGLLCNPRHRYLLYYLVSVDGEVFELADAVTVVRNHEIAGTEMDDHPSRKEVRTTLHHTHLPRLADAEILDYDPRQGTIRLTGYNEAEEWLEYVESKEWE